MVVGLIGSDFSPPSPGLAWVATCVIFWIVACVVGSASTWPKIVYCWLSEVGVPVVKKNWGSLEFGLVPRAIAGEPGLTKATCGTISRPNGVPGRPLLPVPSGFGAPP